MADVDQRLCYTDSVILVGELADKRAWNNFQGSYGKRAWNHFNAGYGKRAWNHFNAGYGKRGWNNQFAAYGRRSQEENVSSPYFALVSTARALVSTANVLVSTARVIFIYMCSFLDVLSLRNIECRFL